MMEFQTDREANRPSKCPLLATPREECYCINLGSLTTEAAIYYCGGNHEECHIYQEHMNPGRREA